MYLSVQKSTKRRRKDRRITWIGMFLVLLVSFYALAWAGPATDSLRMTLDRIIEVLNNPSLISPDKKNERREILHNLLKERFDGDEIARRALGRHWGNRTDEQREEFIRLFNDLLERTYFEKIDTYLEKTKGFSGENITYLAEKVNERYTIVETTVLVDKETEIPVHYLLRFKNDNWFVCDIAIEGVSIVKNYRVQFAEILNRSSFEDLLAQLKNKEQQS
ncbi:MAG: ABC transporter substrate-binding protein [Deltaproteobacteria bacterium]|nr:ABC transporter substrate-binding protein [Deltaproteobacteria bacterium]